ncbi:MAG: bifunctional adenosylcobinamide kinase/adenosylcobinamide-phosphate guanylyltransferase [Pseudobacteriovorax sp.]|nr:bifunctional adenosylcobinamide kinase/adenosylcobinamide-phosphate guanylyltransferase [Pseudobacteriovorax sp.]
MGWFKLVIGGCRSGKSAHALSLAEGASRPAYIATAQVFDEEMAERVERHQNERLGRFTTIEEPIELPKAIRDANGCDAIIVDCLTLWLSNLLLADYSDQDIRDATNDLIEAIDATHANTIVVSNEVGLGIVPDNKLARRFRDLAGFCHQDLSVVADDTIFMLLGKPVSLNKISSL